uniref:Uncharacterized protein n=1 Tax=mine drainage metagenome TaxID=410659 RepID=E6Q158_9ZZZZ
MGNTGSYYAILANEKRSDVSE